MTPYMQKALDKIKDSDSVRVVIDEQSRNYRYGAFREQVKDDVLTEPNQYSIATLLPGQDIPAVDVVFIDCTSGDYNEFLPAASSFLEDNGNVRSLIVKRIDNTANTATINTMVGDTIDGQPNVVLAGIDRPYVRLISNGVNTFNVVD